MGCPGASVREAEILTRVLVAQCVTLQVGPQRQTAERSQDQERVGVAGNPAPIFTPTVASPPGDMETAEKAMCAQCLGGGAIS